MAKSKSLKWFGKRVSAKLRAAQKTGVNQTMAKAAQDAKANHDWNNRTGVLEGGIDIVDFARDEGDGVHGTWGVRDVAYARIHEEGGTIVPRNAEALAIPQPDGGVAFVSSVTIPARPYLRPAADREYPKLAKRIRKAFERGSTGGAG